jgi:acetyltransferase-like isoleucine patch superfamily enzyme
VLGAQSRGLDVRLWAEGAAWRLAVAHAVAAILLPPYSARKVRGLILRLGGADIAVGVDVGGRVLIGHRNVTIGKGCWLAPGCELHASDAAAITLGRRVALGPGVRIVVQGHEIGPPQKRSGPVMAEPVTLEDGAWIGAGALLLPGSVVGAGTVVAAGSVVRGKLEPNSLYAGVPARIKRSLT